MKISIVTGVSRGIGEAVAAEFLKTYDRIYGLSRTGNDDLVREAEARGKHFSFVSVDLSRIDEIGPVMNTIFSDLKGDDVEEILLINNAGTIAPVGPLEECPGDRITAAFNLNTVAPVILTSLFLEKTKDWRGRRLVVNISSGASKNPYEGWSVYCSTKSAIDMFTQVVAKEQNRTENPALITAFAPGTVDTTMQETIRNTDSRQFIHRDRFIRYKERGMLADPADVARVLVEKVVNGTPENGAHLDFRDFIG